MKTLKFLYKNNPFTADLISFSKEDVYGKKIVEKRSEKGDTLKTSKITQDGIHVIPSGGISSFYLDSKGNRVSKVKPIDENGNDIPMIQKMFDKDIDLSSTITIKEYLSYYSIEKTYLLKSNELKNICKELYAEGLMLKFPYAYKTTTIKKDAILIVKNGELIMLVGVFSDLSMSEPENIITYSDEDEELEEFGEFV